MIDRNRFATGMGILGGAFGRIVDDAVIHAYYVTLSPRLETPQWERAVTEVLARETFWPSPARLLELSGRGSDDEAGRAAFRALVDDVRSHGGYRFYPHDRFAALPENVKAGVKRIGGLAAISSMSVEREASVGKQFLEAYRDAARELTPAAATLQIEEPKEDPRARRLIAEVAASIGNGPVAPPADIATHVRDDEYIVEVRAAKAWADAHPLEAKAVVAQVKRENPKLDPESMPFGYRVEAAMIVAWRQSMREAREQLATARSA